MKFFIDFYKYNVIEFYKKILNFSQIIFKIKFELENI